MKSLSRFIAMLFFLSLTHAQDQHNALLSGMMFGDYFYNASRDTGIASLGNTATNGARDFNGFQFRRIYLTYDGDIAADFTSRFRLEGTTGSPFIKDAYIKWKNIFSGSDLTFGLQPTPAFEISEGVWGYRSLEKTIMDLRGIVSPRDLAVSLRGNIDHQGMLGYWLMLGNSSGTAAETDKYKRVYAHIAVKPARDLQLTIYGDYKMQPAVNDLNSTSVPKATLSHNSLTTALFAAYSKKNMFTLGAEGFLQTTPNDFRDGSPDSLAARNAVGLSVFGSYNVTGSFSLVARYDLFDPNTHEKAKGDSRHYFIAGADWKADKNVSIIPNVLYETYEHVGTRSVDASITARITLYYTFL
jgi:hypothetical protein